MGNFRRNLAALLTFVYVVIFLSGGIAKAATVPAIPQIRYVSAPVREYTAGDRIKFDIQSPGYSGRVEYRVVLWEDAKKSYSDLWNSSNGYPSRFYTKWRPTGGTTFNLGWVINKPGSYRITVYTRRVGYSGKKLAKPSANCDSYKESVAFTVKPREIIVDKQGGTYGSASSDSYYVINSSVRVTAGDVTYNNTWVNGDMHLLAGNISLNNVRIDGILYVDPGENGTVNLNNVSANEIQMLSDKNDTIELKNLQTGTLKLYFPDKKTVIAGQNAAITKTIINNSMTIEATSGTFGKIFLVRDDQERIDLTVRSQIPNGITAETNTYIKVENADPETPFSLREMNIISPKGKVITTALDGSFAEVNIWRTAQVALINSTFVNELDSYAESLIYMDDTAKIITLDSMYKYYSISVLANGKIEHTHGDIRYMVDRSCLPGDDSIAGTVNAGVHFGIDDEIDNGIVENPVLRFRLLNPDGSVIPLLSGGDVFFDYGEIVEKYKNIFEGYTYSIPVNKDDGTIALKGGSYRLYLPTYDNKWYVLSFTTKQVGASGEYRSELDSINGKPYTYTPWKASTYTPVNGFITLGTPMADVIKIYGVPSLTNSDNFDVIYYYPSTMIYDPNYIEMYRINGQYVVTGWKNNGGLKVTVGTKDPSAPYIRVGSSKAIVSKALGTPWKISYESDGLEYWRYPGDNIVEFFDNRVVGWVNKGGLKVYMGDKVSGAAPINFSSTMTEVIRAMGTPTAFTEGYNVFGYGDSRIHFSEKTGRVDSWDNRGNLIINTGAIDTSTAGFTIGSTMEEVYRTSGTPTKIQLWYDNSGYCVYGMGTSNISTVYFDKDGIVNKFENDGKIRVSMGTMDPSAPPFFLGSSREDVIRAQGTPRTAYFEGGKLNLCYNEGQVIIDKDGKVVEYKNISGLKVGLGNYDPAAKPYFIGATMEEAASANGAPDSASISTSGEITWKYGSSELEFDGSGKLIRYNNTGNLKVGYLEKDPAAPCFTIGSTMEDVAKANGTPTAAWILINGDTNWKYGNSSVGFDASGKVISYSNAGELLVGVGDGTPAASYFIGSTMNEVAGASGTPDEVGMNDNGIKTTFYRYGTSYVYFNDEGRIVGYYNMGSLKVNAGSMDPSSKPFFTGSTKEEVISANGTPTQVYAATDEWYYGSSNVYFDSNGMVESYYNRGELKAGLGEKDPTASPFFYGSTREDVIRAQGSPKGAAVFKDGTSSWDYGLSTVKFDPSGKVTDITNTKNLNVKLRDKVDNTTFTLGSSMDEVTMAMGTPDNITWASYNNTIIFEYSYSTVIFDISGKVTGYDNSRKNLNVDMGEKLSGASPFTLGSSMDDVIKSNGAPEVVASVATGCTFRYRAGSALVYFDESGIVSGWNNSSILNMIKVSPDPSAPPVAIGSSFDDVIKAMGTPVSYNYSSTDYARTLVYVNSITHAESKIYMDKDGKAAAWDDMGNILRVAQ